MMAAGSLNFQTIVAAQNGGFWHWYWLPLFPLFIVYWISGVAETNRLPFDVAEGESEIVAGFHVEYSGVTFALFFFAEYVNMILISALISLMFLGGWLSPFQGIPFLETWICLGARTDLVIHQSQFFPVLLIYGCGRHSRVIAMIKSCV